MSESDGVDQPPEDTVHEVISARAREIKAREVEEREKREKAVRGLFKFSEAIDVKRLFTALNALADSEIVFQLNEQSLAVTQMDPRRSAMVVFRMDKANFEEFDCRVPGTFCVDVDRILKKPLKNVASKNEQATFTVGYGKATMQLHGSLNRVFPIPLLETPESYEVPPMPKISHTVHAKLVLEAMRKVLKDMDDGGHMETLAWKDSIKFVEHGDEVEMPVSVHMRLGDSGLLTIERNEYFDEPTRAVFSTTYLKAFCEALYPLGDVLGFDYSKDMPVKLTVLTTLDCDFVYWLAPRIESD